MKKRIGLYTTAWIVLFALFNVIAFVSVGWVGQEKYTPAFWIGYIFITLTFIGQFICAVKALNEDDAKKLFYNVSLIKTSYGGLIGSFIVGGLCMLISPLPYWIGVIVCILILAFNILSVVKAEAAIDEVEKIDKKIKTQTIFIKSLSIDAESLLAQAKSDDVKTECRKICEAIRYSDPMSDDALASVESQITIQFHSFAEAVENDDYELVSAVAKNLSVLIADRNKKCQLLK